jgi:hypothetical protein
VKKKINGNNKCVHSPDQPAKNAIDKTTLASDFPTLMSVPAHTSETALASDFPTPLTVPTTPETVLVHQESNVFEPQSVDWYGSSSDEDSTQVIEYALIDEADDICPINPEVPDVYAIIECDLRPKQNMYARLIRNLDLLRSSPSEGSTSESSTSGGSTSASTPYNIM